VIFISRISQHLRNFTFIKRPCLNYPTNITYIFLRLSFSIFDYKTFDDYFLQRKGILSNPLVLGLFMSTTEENKKNDWPDIQMHLYPEFITEQSLLQTAFNIDDGYWDNHLMSALKDAHGVSFCTCLLRPKSR